MSDDILRVAQSFKEQTRGLSQEESMAHFEKQKEQYEREYNEFLEYYRREKCYLCGKSIKTISKE
ncbi:hypothetical protein Q4R54_18600, partial [Morganella morganii]